MRDEDQARLDGIRARLMREPSTWTLEGENMFLQFKILDELRSIRERMSMDAACGFRSMSEK